MERNEKYAIEQARVEDVPFLAKCAINAERAHTGKGIWDLICANYAANCAAFGKVIREEEKAHVHFSHFWVAREIESGQAVAAACGFKYPDCGLSTTKPGLLSALVEQGIFTNTEEGDLHWENQFAFLDESFPDDVEFNNSWMVEAVFTEPSHRGHGLATMVLQSVVEMGRQQRMQRFLITCAIGNNPAKAAYEKLGFHVAGEGRSQKCFESLGSEGFYVLLKEENQ